LLPPAVPQIFGKNFEVISDFSTVYQGLFRRYGVGLLGLEFGTTWIFQSRIVQTRGEIE